MTNIELMNTYHVSGTLERETSYDIFEHKIVSQEINAPNEQAASGLFEVDGWEFAEDLDNPCVRLVTESEKMLRQGQPTLFPLSSIKAVRE